MKIKYHFVFFALALIILSVSCSKHSNQTNQQPPAPADSFYVDIPATESYAEPWSDDNLGINLVQTADNSVVDQWTGNVSVVWYLYVQPGEYKLYLNAMLWPSDSSNFIFTVSCADSAANKNYSNPFKQQSTQFGIRGTNNLSYIFIDSINFPNVGFYRFELKPKYKTTSIYATLKSLRFTSSLSTPGVRFAKYLACPAVHLLFSAAGGVNYNCDWVYGEITVPEGYDPEYTYYECIGIGPGYFGMQVNSSTQRRMIFSIWDSDNEINVPDSLQAKLLDNDPDINYTRFTSEGSGEHTDLLYPWKTGTTVKFLMNARPMNDNSVIFSTWFMDNSSSGWRYMASIRSPQNHQLIDGGFYSFIEDYGQGTGEQIRKAYFSNIWSKILGQTTWVSLSQAYMSYTDGLPDGRSDYADGIDGTGNRFYLQSGGYLNPLFDPVINVPVGTAPPQIDTVALRIRVDQAIKKGGF